MLLEINEKYMDCFLDDQKRLQGEYKCRHANGNVFLHCVYFNDHLHGEYKKYWSTGDLAIHCFFVNGERVSFDGIPYPETKEDRVLFLLKYDIPLLPVETTC